ncbi:type II toxin-antitoxin system RelE family toxin [Microbacterium halophytorum]|uniref:type II toxin-antitoxin system RelE family toxin n=1 Tax=Microbacterium halophytorum TaxID=2067568 RepID=UPI000CFCC2A8|nr:type II toxin-antitoxin system RelE/ParE family toxin [Microbacterium halophytorum]
MTGYELVRTSAFDKGIRRLDRRMQRRVLVALFGLVELPDPTVRLKPLRHSKAGLWRLRVGDYRVIVGVRRTELVVVALDVGHRGRIYDEPA